MNPKIFVKSDDNEALALDRIIRWRWESGMLTIHHEEGKIEITNPSYVGQLHKVLLSMTNTFSKSK